MAKSARTGGPKLWRMYRILGLDRAQANPSSAPRTPAPEGRSAYAMIFGDSIAPATQSGTTQHFYSLENAPEIPHRNAREYAKIRVELYELESEKPRLSTDRRAECRAVALVLRARLAEHSQFDPTEYLNVSILRQAFTMRERRTFSVHLLEKATLSLLETDGPPRRALLAARDPESAMQAFQEFRGPVILRDLVEALLAKHDGDIKTYGEYTRGATYIALIAGGAAAFGPPGALAALAAYRVTKTPARILALMAPFSERSGHPRIEVKPPH